MPIVPARDRQVLDQASHMTRVNAPVSGRPLLDGTTVAGPSAVDAAYAKERLQSSRAVVSAVASGAQANMQGTAALAKGIGDIGEAAYKIGETFHRIDQTEKKYKQTNELQQALADIEAKYAENGDWDMAKADLDKAKVNALDKATEGMTESTKVEFQASAAFAVARSTRSLNLARIKRKQADLKVQINTRLDNALLAYEQALTPATKDLANRQGLKAIDDAKSSGLLDTHAYEAAQAVWRQRLQVTDAKAAIASNDPGQIDGLLADLKAWKKEFPYLSRDQRSQLESQAVYRKRLIEREGRMEKLGATYFDMANRKGLSAQEILDKLDDPAAVEKLGLDLDDVAYLKSYVGGIVTRDKAEKAQVAEEEAAQVSQQFFDLMKDQKVEEAIQLATAFEPKTNAGHTMRAHLFSLVKGHKEEEAEKLQAVFTAQLHAPALMPMSEVAKYSTHKNYAENLKAWQAEDKARKSKQPGDLDYAEMAVKGWASKRSYKSTDHQAVNLGVALHGVLQQMSGSRFNAKDVQEAMNHLAPYWDEIEERMAAGDLGAAGLANAAGDEELYERAVSIGMAPTVNNLRRLRQAELEGRGLSEVDAPICETDIELRQIYSEADIRTAMAYIANANRGRPKKDHFALSPGNIDRVLRQGARRDWSAGSGRGGATASGEIMPMDRADTYRPPSAKKERSILNIMTWGVFD